ncbi:hypothetical protein CDAR_501621 [Caerostris darwini]|uniref:Uncharacterized protein n=1 Tax=Caerostris darwini TaxID=1538125 RepID=A0AAV4PT75_9ARAC|nr:hypothetical protein CDAR_501621 [Caerostris darwini]
MEYGNEFGIILRDGFKKFNNTDSETNSVLSYRKYKEVNTLKVSSTFFKSWQVCFGYQVAFGLALFTNVVQNVQKLGQPPMFWIKLRCDVPFVFQDSQIETSFYFVQQVVFRSGPRGLGDVSFETSRAAGGPCRSTPCEGLDEVRSDTAHHCLEHLWQHGDERSHAHEEEQGETKVPRALSPPPICLLVAAMTTKHCLNRNRCPKARGSCMSDDIFSSVSSARLACSTLSQPSGTLAP